MSDYRVIIPPGASCAVVAGKWTRRGDGTIVAEYDEDELRMCLEITRPMTIKEYIGRDECKE